MDKNLIQRTLSGIIYAIIIFLGTTSYGSKLIHFIFHVEIGQRYLYFGLITVLLAACLFECIRMMRPVSWLWIGVIVLVSGYIYYRYSGKFFGQYFFFGLNSMDVFAIILLVLAIITVFRVPEEMKYDNGKAIFTIVYLAIPFSLALGIPFFIAQVPSFFSWDVFLVFVLIWSSDTFAFLVGKFLGKHKMAPKISPKKTWEGLIGGIVLTVVIGVVLQLTVPGLRGNWIIVGLLIAVIAPLGDLAESQLKRTFDVKDSWSIMPGHGGVLDRLDSFILCAPVVYLYFTLAN